MASIYLRRRLSNSPPATLRIVFSPSAIYSSVELEALAGWPDETNAGSRNWESDRRNNETMDSRGGRCFLCCSSRLQRGQAEGTARDSPAGRTVTQRGPCKATVQRPRSSLPIQSPGRCRPRSPRLAQLREERSPGRVRCPRTMPFEPGSAFRSTVPFCTMARPSTGKGTSGICRHPAGEPRETTRSHRV